jgi:hypothetical protein
MPTEKQSVYEENFNILTKLSASVSETTIWSPKPFKSVPGISINYNAFIQSLRAKIQIKSLPEIPIPVLEPEATRLERYEAFRELEWKNPRFEVSLILKVDNTEEEIHRFTSQSRSPFYAVDLLPYLDSSNPFYLIGPTTSLKAKILDAGYGLPKADDKIVFYGSAQGQVWLWEGLYPETEGASNRSVTVGASSTLVAAENGLRKSLTIVNTGVNPCWLNLQRPAIFGEGIPLNPGGSAYHINSANRWYGMVTAICQSGKTTKLGLSEVSSV